MNMDIRSAAIKAAQLALDGTLVRQGHGQHIILDLEGCDLFLHKEIFGLGIGDGLVFAAAEQGVDGRKQQKQDQNGNGKPHRQRHVCPVHGQNGTEHIAVHIGGHTGGEAGDQNAQRKGGGGGDRNGGIGAQRTVLSDSQQTERRHDHHGD